MLHPSVETAMLWLIFLIVMLDFGWCVLGWRGARGRLNHDRL